jgi:hypothetical protein
MDSNFWGWFCVPLGIALCFGPVLVAWFITATRASDTDKSDHNH